MNTSILRALGRTKELERIEKGLCPTCGGSIGEFRDELSKREYSISGMCQTCQDRVFE